MKLQERLIELAEYGIGFNMYDGSYLVNITYKDGWSVIKPSDDTITFMSDKEKANTYYYSAPITTDMENVFTAIYETISYNKEMEQKLVLFKERIEELQEIFASEPLSRLKALSFVIPAEKKSARGKSEKKNERASKTVQKKKKTVKKEKPKDEGDKACGNDDVTKIDTLIEMAMNEKEKQDKAQ